MAIRCLVLAPCKTAAAAPSNLPEPVGAASTTLMGDCATSLKLSDWTALKYLLSQGTTEVRGALAARPSVEGWPALFEPRSSAAEPWRLSVAPPT